MVSLRQEVEKSLRHAFPRPDRVTLQDDDGIIGVVVSSRFAGVDVIDLLRDGQHTVRVSAEKLNGLMPWHYLVAVTRRWPSREEVYAVPLARRLRRVSIPLAADDRDVTLDLQSVFTRCWNEGPYPELLRYAEPPPGPMTPDGIKWCEQLLSEAALR